METIDFSHEYIDWYMEYNTKTDIQEAIHFSLNSNKNVIIPREKKIIVSEVSDSLIEEQDDGKLKVLVLLKNDDEAWIDYFYDFRVLDNDNGVVAELKIGKQLFDLDDFKFLSCCAILQSKFIVFYVDKDIEEFSITFKGGIIVNDLRKKLKTSKVILDCSGRKYEYCDGMMKCLES